VIYIPVKGREGGKRRERRGEARRGRKKEGRKAGRKETNFEKKSFFCIFYYT